MKGVPASSPAVGARSVVLADSCEPVEASWKLRVCTTSVMMRRLPSADLHNFCRDSQPSPDRCKELVVLLLCLAVFTCNTCMHSMTPLAYKLA